DTNTSRLMGAASLRDRSVFGGMVLRARRYRDSLVSPKKMEQHVRPERSRDRKEKLMAIGRPIPMLMRTDEERDTLERWARRPTTDRRLAEDRRGAQSAHGGGGVMILRAALTVVLALGLLAAPLAAEAQQAPAK